MVVFVELSWDLFYSARTTVFKVLQQKPWWVLQGSEYTECNTPLQQNLSSQEIVIN